MAATYDQLATALRNADAAGDTEGARKLAGALAAMKAKPDFAQASAPSTADPGLQSALDAKAFEAGLGQPGGSYRGTVLPLSRDANGNVGFDSNAGVVGAVKRAIMAPGDAMSGALPVNDPATGHTSEEALARTREMAGVVSPINPAARAGDFIIPGARFGRPQAKVKPPTSQMLHDAAGAQYDSVRDMGVDYRADAITSLASTLRMNLERDGFTDGLAPDSFNVIKGLENPPADSSVRAPLSGVEAARRTLRRVIDKNFTNPTDQEVARRAIAELDKFTENPDPAAVVAGPAAAAGKIQADARGNYAAGKRSERLQGVEDAADLRAAAANSGQNIDNAIRTRVASILLDPKKRAGFNREEQAALEQVAKGTATRNTLRYVGNLLGGGGGLGAAFTGLLGGSIGGAAGGLPGIAIGVGLPLVGVASKKAANSATRKALSMVDEAVRSRSPLYDTMQRNAAPTAARDPALRAALIRALILSAQDQGAQQ